MPFWSQTKTTLIESSGYQYLVSNTIGLRSVAHETKLCFEHNTRKMDNKKFIVYRPAILLANKRSYLATKLSLVTSHQDISNSGVSFSETA